jgi:hypothetical protein
VGDIWSQLVVLFEENGGEIKYIKLLKMKRKRDNTLNAMPWWLNSDNLAG